MAVHKAPLEANKDVLPVGMRSLRILGKCQQATRPSRCLYYERNIDICKFTESELVLVEYWLSGG